MPSADEILNALTVLAQKYVFIAAAWHALIVWLLFVLFKKQKPFNQSIGYILTLPLFSVSFFAWQAHNPFNGILFTVAGILLLLFTRKTKKEEIILTQPVWLRISGIIIFLSGLFYPHFLGNNFLIYLYASPVGLVPCPTLLVLTGFVTIFNNKQSTPWLVSLFVIDLFYGLFGVLKLNVYLDIILIAASVLLTVPIAFHQISENKLSVKKQKAYA